MRARHRQAVGFACKHIGRGCAAAHHGGAACPHAAAGALSTSQAELGDGQPVGSQAHPSGLGGDERFEVNAVQKRRLDELAIHDGAHHAHDRLVREHHGALDHGIDVHAQRERAQVIQKRGLEQPAPAGRIKACQVLHVLGAEREPVDKLGELVHSASDGVAATEGIVAEIRMEARLRGALPRFPIPLRHGQLIQIGEQLVTVFPVHVDTS